MIEYIDTFKRAGHWVLPALLLASCGLAGCDLLDRFMPPAQPPVKHAVGEPSVDPSRGGPMTNGEKLGFFRWLVTEMEEQIFSQPVRDKSGAIGWANVLAQRGSVEGVYHGFILSTDYGNLEQLPKSADIKALRFYGLEMALMDFPFAKESDANVQGASATYVQKNMNRSIFTLKRELGERILKEALKRKDDEEKLAAWYSGIVARWAKLDIPFGLPQRNIKDEVFHFNWAKENTLGMLEWELLNREHRIFNQLGGIAVTPAPSAPNARQGSAPATP